MPFQTLNAKREKKEVDTPTMSRRMIGGSTEYSGGDENSKSRLDGSISAAELTFEAEMQPNWREKDDDDFFDNDPFQKKENSLSNSARSFHSSNGSDDRDSSEGIKSRSESTYSF